MGHLSTHVLDTMNGCPAAGMTVELLRHDGEQLVLIKALRLNADGRNDGGPLLDASTMATGRYRLVFHVADYFRARGAALPDPPMCPCWSAPGRTAPTGVLEPPAGSPIPGTHQSHPPAPPIRVSPEGRDQRIVYSFAYVAAVPFSPGSNRPIGAHREGQRHTLLTEPAVVRGLPPDASGAPPSWGFGDISPPWKPTCSNGPTCCCAGPM
jgi:5-hydroxyisourate hydrolase